MIDLRPQEGLRPTLVVSHLIGGQAVPGAESFARRNPAWRDDVVTLAPLGDAAVVARACEAARAAQRDWGRTPAPQRAEVLRRLALLLRATQEDLARFVVREIGKPIAEARGSVQEAIDTAELFLSEGRRLHGQTVPSELADKELATYRRPLGVVGIITPGNFPVAVPSWKLIPALLCGNTIVWKPSEDAPGTAALLADLVLRAGVPAGVFNVVFGTGAGGAGAALLDQVEAGRVDKIAFTGSTEVGREVGARCGRALQVPSLELGGKNPLVILADADVELAVEGALWSAFGTAGQRCTSAGNIIVDKRILPLVRDLLVTRTRSLVIGDPQRENVAYGPLINERFLSQWIEQRAIGLGEGADLLLDGRRIVTGEEPPGFIGTASSGLYATPRIFDKVKMSMRIAREECFGPTVNLVEANGLDEAISLANAAPYGLAAAIYTRDARAMLRFKEQVEAGMVSINNSTTGAETHLPFGGTGWSGNGTREGGMWVLDAYTRWQAVNVDLSGSLQKAQIDLRTAPPPQAPDWAELGGRRSGEGRAP